MSTRRRGGNAIDDALQRMKQKGKSRLDEFEDSDEELFDYMEEEEYSRHVAKNREKAKRFIVSDGIVDSTEYQDDGEEFWVQQQEREEKENHPTKSSNIVSQKQQTRISSLLLKTAATAKPQKAQETQRKSVMSADTLDSYLDEFDLNPFDNDNATVPTPSADSAVSTQGVPLKQAPVPTTPVVAPVATPAPATSVVEEAAPVTESSEEETPEHDETPQPEPVPEERTTQKPLQFNPAPPKKEPVITPAPAIVKSTPTVAPTKKAAPVEKVEQNDWFSMCDENNGDASPEQPETETDQSEMQMDDTEESARNFFFLDACYEREMPGTVVLFGKYLNPKEGNKPQSCTVRVENLSRTLYFLPRVFRAEQVMMEDGTEAWVEDQEKPVSVRDVCQEFNQLRKQFGIKEFRAKPVKRNYCFTLPNVPRGDSEYVKIKFQETSQLKKMTDLPLEGATYRHVFALNQNLLEHVILKRRLMGPQWLSIHAPKDCPQRYSWSKHEWRVDSMGDVVTLQGPDTPPVPDLVVMSLKITTILNHKKQANEVVLASALVHNNVKMDGPTRQWEKSLNSFTAIRKLEGIPWPMNFQQTMKARSRGKRQLMFCESEVLLLTALMNFISATDPDVIVGHNFIGFDLDVLLHRMKANNVSTWSKLGRLQRRHMPKLQQGAGGQRDSTWAEKKITSGRLICDTYLASKDLAMIRQASYSLTSLAKEQLAVVRYEVDHDGLHEYYRKGFSALPPGATSAAKNQIQYLDDRNLEFLIKHSENDSYLQLALMFKFQIIPLTKQLTNLSGNLWARSLTGSRAERISFYLLHEFHNRKFIIPDKQVLSDKSALSRKKKQSYHGGLVLAPKRGLYDQLILLLDFNSLYPSLIQEYNICFTTLDTKSCYNEEGGFVPIEELPSEDLDRGVLPSVLKTLIDRRRVVKQMLKTERDPLKLQQLDIKQKALKLTANSMYGCLGFPASRFFAMPLAELITRKGREALSLSKTIAEDKLGYDVVYGDTDSIMVNTNTTDIAKAREIAGLIKKTINQSYSQLELDLDGIFKTMLLLKKKKYAALMITSDDSAPVRETKGLDLVRRDWCPLSKRVGEQILDFILSGKPIDEVLLYIHEFLRETAANIQTVPLDQFVITKSLSKEPEQYAKSTPLPHVNVALALIQQGKAVRVGNHIPYVICDSLDEETSCSYAQRAYHPEHIRKAGGVLEVDYDWYLENQILAPVLRLCDPIEGTSAKRIAECLGLQDSKLAGRYSEQGSHDDDRYFSPLSLDDVERYKDAEPFTLRCHHCQHSFPFQSIAYKQSTHDGDTELTEYFVGHTCTNDLCQLELDYSVVHNQLHQFIRKHIAQYYAGWLVCDDPACSHRTRTLFVKNGVARCTVARCGGKMKQEYNSSRLYNQLCYLQSKLDFTKFKSEVSTEVGLTADAYYPFYTNLGKIVQQYLDQNAHNFVDCQNLFSCFAPSKK